MAGSAELIHFQQETPKQGLYNPDQERDACGVGFVADLTGTHTRATVTDALHVLNHLTHRGACGCETETGDGAGIIVGMPDKFLRKIVKADCGVDLPPKGRYAVGNVFFVKDDKIVAAQKKTFTEVVESFGLTVLAWRKVPVRPGYGKGLGATAAACEPYQEQIYVAAPDSLDVEKFNPLLFEVRQKAQYATEKVAGEDRGLYICSLSANVLTYKGMLKSEQVTTPLTA
jgi:glutamate synthase (NADPH/NADH) large chain